MYNRYVPHTVERQQVGLLHNGMRRQRGASDVSTVDDITKWHNIHMHDQEGFWTHNVINV